jgi:CBS domain-containing protein
MSMEQTVLEAKRIGVYTCKLDCILGEAVRRMVDEDISALVVVDEEGCLAGIITRADLLRAYLKIENWESELVAKYMTSKVVTATPETRLSQVAEMLLEKQIHRVVVVRGEEAGRRRPIAVVSSADLVYHMVNLL